MFEKGHRKIRLNFFIGYTKSAYDAAGCCGEAFEVTQHTLHLDTRKLSKLVLVYANLCVNMPVYSNKSEKIRKHHLFFYAFFHMSGES